jgi:hypothetical protein
VFEQKNAIFSPNFLGKIFLNGHNILGELSLYLIKNTVCIENYQYLYIVVSEFSSEPYGRRFESGLAAGKKIIDELA